MKRSILVASVAAFAVLGALAGTGAVDDAQAAQQAALLEVRVRDAASGAPLDHVRAALVDAGTGRVYARFDSADYHGPRRPRAGDRVYAYARGYGISSSILTEEQHIVELALEPADRAATVRLLVPPAARRGGTAEFRARVSVSAEGAWPAPDTPELRRAGRSPIEDAWVLPLADQPIEVRWGAGSLVRVSVDAGDRIVWPLFDYLRSGRASEFHLEVGRALAVERPAPGGARIDQLEVVLDRLWRPDVDPRRVDAWRWHLNGPDWLEAGLKGAAPRLDLTPAVPFHVLARIDGAPLQIHVDDATARIDLRRPGTIAILTDRPRIGGEPAPGGALIAAGRLDRLAICEFEALRGRVPGFVHVLSPREEPWRPLRLPSDDWLTVFDREKGLAHLRWGAQVPPEGTFAKGVLVLEPPPGYRATGSVTVFPVWKGSGAVGTAPPRAPRLRHDWPATGDLVVSGLVGGTYGLDVEVEYAQEGTGRKIRAPRFASVDVTGEPPRGELRLALPPR